MLNVQRPCAGEGLFVEGSPDVAVLATDAFVVVTTTIRPKAVVLTEQQRVVVLHLTDDRIDTIGTACRLLTWHETRQGIFRLRHSSICRASVPPRRLVFTTHEHTIVLRQPAIDNLIMIRLVHARRHFLINEGLEFALGNIARKYSGVNPHLHGSTRLQSLFSHLDGLLNGRRTAGISITFQHATLGTDVTTQTFLQL